MIEDDFGTRLERGPGPGLWTLTAPKWSLSRPVVAGGRVYVSVDGWITALDRETGEQVWRSPYRCSTSRSQPLTVASSCVVVQGPEGVAVAVLETESGSELRRIDVRNHIGHVSDGRTVVVAHAPDGRMFTGYDVRGGDPLWSWPDPIAWGAIASVRGMEVMDGRLVLYGGEDNEYRNTPRSFVVRGYDLRTGSLLWRRPFPNAKILSPPRASEAQQRLVFVWCPDTLCLTWLSAADGEEVGRLTYPSMSEYARPRLFDDERTLWITKSGGRSVYRFRAFEPEEPRVTYRLVEELSVYDLSLAVAGGWLYATTNDGMLAAARADRNRWPRRVRHRVRVRGTLRWRMAEGHERLVAGGDYVYARAWDRRGWASVVALRHGQELWRRRHCSPVEPLPCDDRVLLMESDKCAVPDDPYKEWLTGRRGCARPHDQDRLLMVDAETGATTGSP
ncbi:PQQ-binding-like beta-propeller repeat protein [Streptomyces sp. NPDC048825]|uniref:outer membrane protein assembly factor BamB family protein n=1 Tax=Streptomyces sp. NPDC048825 TaxID=3365592 RepID=UPI0037116224